MRSMVESGHDHNNNGVVGVAANFDLVVAGFARRLFEWRRCRCSFFSYPK